MSHYGLQCGGMVHVLSKKRSNNFGNGVALTDVEANQIASALKSAAGGLRSALAVRTSYFIITLLHNITILIQYFMLNIQFLAENEQD